MSRLSALKPGAVAGGSVSAVSNADWVWRSLTKFREAKLGEPPLLPERRVSLRDDEVEFVERSDLGVKIDVSRACKVLWSCEQMGACGVPCPRVFEANRRRALRGEGNRWPAADVLT